MTDPSEDATPIDLDPASFDPSVPFREAKRRAIEMWERWYVLSLIQYTDGNLSRASRVAQTDRTYLRKLLRRYTEMDSAEAGPDEAGDQGSAGSGSVTSDHTGQ